MKKIKTGFILIVFLIIGFSSDSIAQPPDPPEDPQSGGEVVGGGAPIGSGLGILLALGAAYGGKKVYNYKQRQKSN
jgi:hypothetical protein